jgi:hypothetical protein
VSRPAVPQINSDDIKKGDFRSIAQASAIIPQSGRLESSLMHFASNLPEKHRVLGYLLQLAGPIAALLLNEALVTAVQTGHSTYLPFFVHDRRNLHELYDGQRRHLLTIAVQGGHLATVKRLLADLAYDQTRATAQEVNDCIAWLDARRGNKSRIKSHYKKILKYLRHWNAIKKAFIRCVTNSLSNDIDLEEFIKKHSSVFFIFIDGMSILTYSLIYFENHGKLSVTMSDLLHGYFNYRMRCPARGDLDQAESLIQSLSTRDHACRHFCERTPARFAPMVALCHYEQQLTSGTTEWSQEINWSAMLSTLQQALENLLTDKSITYLHLLGLMHNIRKGRTDLLPVVEDKVYASVKALGAKIMVFQREEQHVSLQRYQVGVALYIYDPVIRFIICEPSKLFGVMVPQKFINALHEIDVDRGSLNHIKPLSDGDQRHYRYVLKRLGFGEGEQAKQSLQKLLGIKRSYYLNSNPMIAVDRVAYALTLHTDDENLARDRCILMVIDHALSSLASIKLIVKKLLSWLTTAQCSYLFLTALYAILLNQPYSAALQDLVPLLDKITYKIQDFLRFNDDAYDIPLYFQDPLSKLLMGDPRLFMHCVVPKAYWDCLLASCENREEIDIFIGTLPQTFQAQLVAINHALGMTGRQNSLGSVSAREAQQIYLQKEDVLLPPVMAVIAILDHLQSQGFFSHLVVHTRTSFGYRSGNLMQAGIAESIVSFFKFKPCNRLRGIYQDMKAQLTSWITGAHLPYSLLCILVEAFEQHAQNCDDPQTMIAMRAMARTAMFDYLLGSQPLQFITDKGEQVFVKNIVCSITQKVPREPVMLDGRLYERAVILEVIEENRQDSFIHAAACKEDIKLVTPQIAWRILAVNIALGMALPRDTDNMTVVIKVQAPKHYGAYQASTKTALPAVPQTFVSYAFSNQDNDSMEHPIGFTPEQPTRSIHRARLWRAGEDEEDGTSPFRLPYADPEDRAEGDALLMVAAVHDGPVEHEVTVMRAGYGGGVMAPAT